MFKPVIFLLAVFVFFSCTGKKKEQVVTGVQQRLPGDSTLIFNGYDLDGWEVTNFGPQGPVSVSSGSIILGMGDGCTGVTFKKDFPKINYEVTLDAKRVTGTDFFCGITFPVNYDPCSLIIGGWGGTVVGLSCINGKDASENETTRLMKFDPDRWYNVKLVVKSDSIKAWIDGQEIVGIGTSGRSFSIRPEVNLSKPFGIASWNTTAAIKNIRVQRL